MLKNYALMSWRSARRDLSGFFINIIGLLVGFTVFTVTFSAAHYIETFDRDFTYADRTYTLNLLTGPGSFRDEPKQNNSYSGAIDGLKERAPEILYAGRVLKGNTTYEKDGSFFPLPYKAVDADSLTIFDVTITEGSAEAFTSGLDVALLSRKAEKHFFPGGGAVGETLTIGNGNLVTIAGVYENLPANSHLSSVIGGRFAFDFLIPVALHEKLTGRTIKNGWTTVSSDLNSYVVVTEGTSLATLEKRLSEQLFANGEFTNDAGELFYLGMWAMPLAEFATGSAVGGPINGPIVFRILGGLILGLAVLNAISLASARMINRSREIGLRRIFGANRLNLTIQFIFENTIYALLALVISVIFTMDIYTRLYELTGFNIVFSAMWDMELMVGLVFAAVVVGVLSSLYPIILFSGVLKSVSINRTLSMATSANWLKKILVGTQFTVVAVLVLVFIVIQEQHQYLIDDIHPVDADRMAVIQRLETDGMNRTVAQTIRKLPGVQSVSLNNLMPYSTSSFTTVMNIQGVGTNLIFQKVSLDTAFFEQLNIPLLAGRYLDETRVADTIVQAEEGSQEGPRTDRYMVNEAAMRQLGYTNPSEIVGQTFALSSFAIEVVGVVPDTKVGIPIDRPSATLFSVENDYQRNLTILFEPGASINLSALEQAWQAVDPSAQVEVKLLNEVKAEALQVFEFLRYFLIAVTSIVITLAAAGLYALTAYLAASKRREVAIRKVHGAPIRRILQLLVWQFTKPVTISLALALPLTFLFLDTQILSLYSNRIELDATPVLVTVLLIMTMAIGTSFVHIAKTARSRPAEVLRSD